jgi:type I restriction enzyme S subunit
MSEEAFPESWTQIPIEDCLLAYENGRKIRQGWSPQCENHPAETMDDWGVLKTSAIQDGEYVESANKQIPKKLAPKTQLEVEAGDILITCAGPRSRCGVTCLVRKTRPKLLISGKMYQLRVDPEIIDRHLLELFLREPGTKKKIDEMKTGISDSGLNLTHSRFSTLEIPLPPLAEQKRIVSKIEELFSELDAGEESLRRARRQLGVYRQSLLKQAFEGKLTAPWRQRNTHLLESPDQLLERIQAERQAQYEEQLKKWEKAVKDWEKGGTQCRRPSKPREPKKVRDLDDDVRSELADLPEEWLWSSLGLMTLGVEYGTAAKSQKDGKCPVIRMGNLQGGEIDWDDLVFTSDTEEIAQYELQAGDVLFNRTNSPELVGKTAIYRGTRTAVFAGYLIRVNQIPSVVASGYLNHFLNSPTAKQYGNTVKTDGVNQSNINGEKLCGYPFPYCSLPEQEEIVRLLDEQFTVIEQNERDIDAALKRSAALRQSILKKAFTGQLVPQDPTDEPASALLDRIRRDRAPSQKKTSR